MADEIKAARPVLTLNNFKKKEPEATSASSPALIKEQERGGASVNNDFKDKSLEKQEDSNSNLKDNRQSKSRNKSCNGAQETGVSEALPEKQKIQRKLIINEKDYKAILEYMREHYPKCFPAASEKRLPLAIGIHSQLMAIEGMPFSKTKIRAFLKSYTRGKKYQEALSSGADRIGLDGQVTLKILKQWALLHRDEEGENGQGRE
jgi:hypothetical protein